MARACCIVKIGESLLTVYVQVMTEERKIHCTAVRSMLKSGTACIFQIL